MPLGVSVIIPARDVADTIGETLDSVLSQRGVDLEVVVVDDGSTDSTTEVVQTFDDDRIRLVDSAGTGVCAARNHGARLARAERLVFLDADDVLAPGALAALCAPATILVCGASRSTGGPAIRVPVVSEFMVQPFLAGTFAISKGVFNDVGHYDERLGHSENSELSIRLMRRLEPTQVAIVTQVVATHRLAEVRGRALQYAERIVTSMEIMFQEHGTTLEQIGCGAVYASSAGVAAARLGRWSEARRWFVRALRDRERRWSDVGRLALSTIPTVGKRVWGAHTTS